MSYRLEPLVREDAKLLKSWDEFSDPIFYGYNYNNLNENQEEIWFLMKQKKYRSSYFSIKDEEGNLLGFIGLKKINNILNTAKLGIVIAPSFVSNGLGTSVMEEFIAMCLDLNDERYEDIRDSFIIEDGVIYSKVIHMSLNRQEYRNESRTRKK